MSKCIQPTCTCTGYKEPTQPKSSLLQFRLKCQECGHQASEHRKLTAVDHFIKSQVAAGRRNHCTSQILLSDVPLSPVFGMYDIIPFPTDDNNNYWSPGSESGVLCTCKGFQLPDVIRLCQKLRTHSMSDVTVELKSTACSFCNHPLSAHLEEKNILPLYKKHALGIYKGLSLKCSSLLSFSPANQECLELVMPLNTNDGFLLVSVGKFQDSDIPSLAFLSYSLAEEKSIDTLAVDVDFDVNKDGVAGNDSIQKKRLTGQEFSQDKRRRSLRIATMAVTKEKDRMKKQLKGLKGAEKQVDIDINDLDGRGELTNDEHKRVVQSSISFVRHLGIRDQYRSFPLPKDFLDTRAVFLVMATLRISDSQDTKDADLDTENMDTDQDTGQDTGQDIRHSEVLVTVGSRQTSDVFITAINGSDQNVVWHRIGCMEKGKLECLVLSKEADDLVSNKVWLLAGMNSGFVSVWQVVLEKNSLNVPALPFLSFNCNSQVMTMSCSPDSKMLAVGTMLGEVVFCVLTKDETPAKPTQPFVQPVQCCSATIKCITWTRDRSLVAVGACDDTIQVLQLVEPPKRKFTKTSSKTLFHYFELDDDSRRPIYVHTFTLKGHSSFIADLKFIHGHCLVSIGWDTQILFWRHLLTQRGITNKYHRTKVEVLEPVGGYKLGPSYVPLFLPLLLRSIMGCGLMVGMVNKLGGTSVACYLTPFPLPQ